MDGRSEHAELVRAFEAARASGDIDAMSSAALSLASRQQFGTQRGRTPAYLHQAYQLASGKLRIRLAVALARTWTYGGEPARAAPFAAEAVAAAEQCADAELLAAALDADLLAHWGPDQLADRLRITARLEDTVAHLFDAEARLSCSMWRLTTALENLDPITMQRQLRALDELAADTGSARVGLFAASRSAAHALIIGDLATARTCLRSVSETGRAAGEPDTGALVHELTAQIARQAGDQAGLAEQALAFDEFGSAQGVAAIAAEGALYWLESGRPERARELLDRMGRPSDVPRDVDWLLIVCVLTEVAAGTGALEYAAEAHELLEPYAGRGVVNAGGVVFLGVVDDFLRMACLALGREDEAAGWSRSAAAGYQRLGAQWWLRRLEVRSPRQPSVSGPLIARLREGTAGVWTVGTDGHSSAVRELKGFRYLRLLLERPGTEVSALELAATASGHPGEHATDGSFGPQIDRQALLSYRKRLAELDSELAQARDWSDQSRTALLTAERGMLLDELAGATGLGGRPRYTGASSERARVAVKKALSAAIARITDIDPALGRLLRDTIRTGSGCSYQPDPARPVQWVFRD